MNEDVLARKMLKRIDRYKYRTATSEKDIRQFEKEGWEPVKRGSYRYRKEKSKPEFFEERIRTRLKDFGFNDAGGGPHFKLGGHQIDACGGCDTTFLVIDCKSKYEQGVKNIKAFIDELNGKKEDIEKDVRKTHKQKYSEVIFIIWLEDIDFSTRHDNYARNKDIHLRTSEYLGMYEQSYMSLVDTTKYHILKEAGAKPKFIEMPAQKEGYSIPAFKITHNGKILYSFVIEAEKLLKIAYVFRYGLKEQEAYQRLLEPRKLDLIGKYIDNNGYFANNIILAPEEPLQFTKKDLSLKTDITDVDIGTLIIPNIYCSSWIIDGQHRSYGFLKAQQKKRSEKLHVIAIEKLSKIEQARLFVDINETQTTIETDLLWDLLGDTQPDTEQGKISKLVKELNRSGPLKNKIYIPKQTTKTYPFKISTICKGIKTSKLLREGYKYSLYKGFTYTIKYPVLVVKSYFSIVETALNKCKKNLEDLGGPGIRVMFMLLSEIMRYRRDNYEEFDTASTKKLIQKPLQEYLGSDKRLYEIKAANNNEKRREVLQQLKNKIQRYDKKYADYLKKK